MGGVHTTGGTSYRHQTAGSSWENSIGTIAPGKRADLVIMKGDPSNRIEHLGTVEAAFKESIGYDLSKLIESVSGVVESR